MSVVFWIVYPFVYLFSTWNLIFYSPRNLKSDYLTSMKKERSNFKFGVRRMIHNRF